MSKTQTNGAVRAKPLSMAQKFEAMSLVAAAPANLPDSDLAAYITTKVVGLVRPVTAANVTSYRVALGVPPVRQPTRAELRARLEVAEQSLAEARQAKLRLDPGTESDQPLMASAAEIDAKSREVNAARSACDGGSLSGCAAN